ncbi:MAG: hypothetical protein RMM58_05935 [Chloroflexota bacterium]|nr:hypothetical protein [Dehalococcoidia bacterium]MDW8253401.1 hypothetical protein [Chloroflexota bacterium]
MADATMERPEGRAQRYLDLVDQLGKAEARNVIREALVQAGVKPVEIDWKERRAKTLALLDAIERALDRDLARLAA